MITIHLFPSRWLMEIGSSTFETQLCKKSEKIAYCIRWRKFFFETGKRTDARMEILTVFSLYLFEPLCYNRTVRKTQRKPLEAGMHYDTELVGKIGSMALIRREDNDIDYNIFSRLGSELKPGMIWVSSGAAEIGRLDYIKRTGRDLTGDPEEIKTDYAAQGQAILMEQYRRFIRPEYSVRQVLVEHQHFNEPEKRKHIRELFLRCREQGAIPIVNYNDPVSDEENRKWELTHLRMQRQEVVECVDNDETAAVIAGLFTTRVLLIMTSTEGIYQDPNDSKTLVREVTGKSVEEVVHRVRTLQKCCIGASRAGANGAFAKLEYALGPVSHGTRVIIGHARHRISDLVEGRVPCTHIGIE